MQWFPNHKISSKILAINATFLLFPGIVTFTGCFRITMMHPTNLLSPEHGDWAGAGKGAGWGEVLPNSRRLLNILL